MRLGLKNALTTSGRSQRTIARALNIREGRMSDIIRGHAEPTAAEQAGLMRVLGISSAKAFINTEAAPVAEELQPV